MAPAVLLVFCGLLCFFIRPAAKRARKEQDELPPEDEEEEPPSAQSRTGCAPCGGGKRPPASESDDADRVLRGYLDCAVCRGRIDKEDFVASEDPRCSCVFQSSEDRRDSLTDVPFFVSRNDDRGDVWELRRM